MHFVWCRFYVVAEASMSVHFVLGMLAEGSHDEFVQDLCDAAGSRGFAVHGVDVLCASAGFKSMTEHIFLEHIAPISRGEEWSFPIVLVYCHRRLNRALRYIGTVAG
jgi:hypothetical protein